MLDFDTLNPAQREAVMHGDGPCCVVAGAGSGKTRVLTYRIARLIDDGVPPHNILAVTFTRKAAAEMQERLHKLVGAAAEDVNMGTFHSICYRILREEWRARNIPPYEPAQESWQKRVIRKILAPPGKDNPYGMNWDLDVSQALSWISWQKNNLITPEKVKEDGFLTFKYQELYKKYEEIKDQERKLDFDDMLLWCYLTLQDRQVRARWANQFKYILVDEYQDTNVAQNEILKLLARPLNNVFVVGDARQAIYEWRCAKPEFILNFERDWPGARTIVLDINYRSTDNIVQLSNRLIGMASIRYPGACRANRPAFEEPLLLESENEEEEARKIAAEIAALVTGHNEYRYGDIAVLYRTNAQARALEDALIRAQIPYVVYGAVGFYQRREVKDILAYLRIVVDPNDTEAIARVINVPSRYLGKAFFQKAVEYAYRNRIPLLEGIRDCPEALQGRYRRGVVDFLYCISRLQHESTRSSPARMVALVREITGYDAWLRKEEGAMEDDDCDRLENLEALALAAGKFRTLEEFLDYADRLSSRNVEENGGDKVVLMTIHKAKGLEFPVVFVAGLANGLLPHRKAIRRNGDGEIVPESIEEERRLCYVAITRAKDRLYLSTIESYLGRPLEPSVFMEALKTEEGLECRPTESPLSMTLSMSCV